MDISGTINYNARSAFKRGPDGFGKSASVGPDRGCSSGVEHNLAKVGVVGSNPIARSNFQNIQG
jgi:hypothetical protein